jgi:hypothetical protein
MRVHSSVLAIGLAGSFALASIASADETVPFRGTWSGTTVSAMPDPGGQPAFLVVSEGYGEATRLGRFFMSSPHLSFFDLSVAGEQIFTAANGDMLFATFAGQFAGDPAVALEATLTATITGGTGRFAGATGTYDFHIIATFNGAGYDSVATIDGEISSVGSAK